VADAVRGVHLSHFTPSAAIRAFGAHELLTIPDCKPGYVARRMERLIAVLERCGVEGLLTIDPAIVAAKFYSGRRECSRKTRTARPLEAVLEDFRAWHARQAVGL
jgi:hypothetical protein